MTSSILDHTQRRESKLAVIRRVRALGRQLAQVKARYQGGLVAEQQSYERVRREISAAIRRELLARRGRRIDLVAILQERRPDKTPRWCLADPRRQISECNGTCRYDGGGVYTVLVADNKIALPQQDGRNLPTVTAAGMPPLPKKVRRLLGRHSLLKHAAWVGVLFQPEEWEEVRPDPAVVVEWKDLPGQYFALAVWGGDRARIMEFVD